MAPFRKRQKLSSNQPSELVFDPTARQDYLTGFHKRKLARAEHAREQAVKKAREEKVEERRQLREQRKQDLEAHVQAINREYKKLNPDLATGSDDEEDGEEHNAEMRAVVSLGLDQEEEFVDEDKYTTVTVEPLLADEDDANNGEAAASSNTAEDLQRSSTGTSRRISTGTVKKKKKKFRYESKAERKQTRFKQSVKNKKAAMARKAEK